MKKVFWFLILLFAAGFAIHHYNTDSPGANLPENENYPAIEVRHSYDALISEESKEIYEEMEHAVYGEPDEERSNVLCEFEDVDPSEAYLGYRAFTDDHPEVFWITRGYQLLKQDSLYILSIYPKEELAEKKEEFRVSLEHFLESVPEGLDQEGLEEYVNSYLMDCCEYDYEALAMQEAEDPDRQLISEAGSAYGALVKGKAVCAGYACAYQVLLNRVGVECVQIYGQGNSMVDGKRSGKVDHAWNAVRNGNTWLMTDVTWNDVLGDQYRYYNLPIDEMYRDHNARAVDVDDFHYFLFFNKADDDNWDNLFLPE